MNPHEEHPLPPASPVAPEDPYGITDLVIEDDEPVDSTFAEKLQRLLTTVLYLCWARPGGATHLRRLR